MVSKYKLIWHLMEGERLRYSAAIASLVVASSFLYLVPLVPTVVIDGVLADAPGAASSFVLRAVERAGGREFLRSNLWLAALAIVGFTAVSGIFTHLRGRWAGVASERITRRVRERLYDQLQHLPSSFYDRSQTGDLVQRCTSDVDTLRMFLIDQVVEIGRAALMLLIPLPLMFAVDPRMALVSLTLIPPITIFSIVFFHRVRSSFEAVDQAEGRMSGTLQENLTGIRVVRAFARQEYEIQKFAARNGEHRDLHLKLFRLLASFWSFSDLMCMTQIAIVVFAGGRWLAAGTLAAGGFMFFLMVVSMFLWPVRMMGRILTELGKATVAIGRIHDILGHPRESAPASDERSECKPARAQPLSDERSECKPARAQPLSDERSECKPARAQPLSDERSECKPARAQPLSDERSECKRKRGSAQPQETPQPSGVDVRGEIVFQGVTFSHRPGEVCAPSGLQSSPHQDGRAALVDISFRVEAGRTVALLGPSGSGKSTIVNLLLRFYEPDKGAIEIDGRNIVAMDRKEVRRLISVVMQEPFLFSKTLRENIVLGHTTAAHHEVTEAATAACVHETILEFETGYDTLVGERGITLSGGQRQRVALARALLKQPTILILDDALSAVDTDTEALILDALRDRRGRHTTIVIAHRLSTLMDADEILVLDHGRIVQRGPHEVLKDEPGLYRRVLSIQNDLEEQLRRDLDDAAGTQCAGGA